MKLSTILMGAAVLAFAVVPAHAVLVPLSADMDGAQANAGAGTGSPGTGTASLSLETDTNTLNWVIEWSGLLGTPTLMHFHGPALPNQNAGVQVNIGVVGPPVVGAAVLTDDQENDILAGLWYVNLHTDQFPGGEIRGAVVNDAVPVAESTWGQVKAVFR